MELENVERWCQGKHDAIQLLAKGFVVYADIFCQLAKIFQIGKTVGEIENVENDEWLSFYRSRRKVLCSIEEDMCDDEFQDDSLLKLILFIDDYMQILRTKRQDIECFFEEIKANKEALHEFIYEVNVLIPKYNKQRNIFFDKFNMHLSEINSLNIGETDLVTLKSKPNIYYLLNVWIATWLIYGTFPTRIIRQARQGDRAAMELAIRLDKKLLFDRHISKHISRLLHIDSGFNEELAKWIGNGPTVGVKRQLVKVRFAHYLIDLSIKLSKIGPTPVLKNIDLFRLYEAYAIDRGLGVDSDFKSHDAFNKAMQRNRNFWHISPSGQN